jgi:ADP-ribose pyrophosphatase
MPSTTSPLPPFVTLERETIASCRVFEVERVRRRSGRTGEAHDYFHIRATDWVNVVAVTPEDKLVLVRQERHGTESFTLELPGGMVDAGETPAEAALRELREETGYSGTLAEPLGFVHPNPALQHNRCFTYLARDVRLGGSQRLDSHEEIEVVTMPWNEVREAVRTGLISHALVVGALYKYELGRPETTSSDSPVE